MRKEHVRRHKFSISTGTAVKGWVAFCSVIPALVALLMICIMPAMLNVALSLTDYNGDINNLHFIGLSNYKDFFGMFGEDVWNAIVNTIKYMLMTILPIQVVAIVSALLINSNIKLKNIFRAIYFLPSILGITVVCTTWGIMYDPIDGPLVTLFNSLHKVFPFIRENYPFLGSEKTAMTCVAIVTVWTSFGFSMAIYLAGLAGISSDYYEAAKLEGAGVFAVFFKITLPLLWPSVTICLFLALQGTIGMSDYIILLTGGGRNTTTIGFYMYSIVMNNTVSHGQAAAVSMCFFVFTSAVMLAFTKLLNRKEVEL